jgi:hypothetical protein
VKIEQIDWAEAAEKAHARADLSRQPQSGHPVDERSLQACPFALTLPAEIEYEFLKFA